jgi:hypothetical protein
MASQVIVVENIQRGVHIVVFWDVIPFFQNDWLAEWKGCWGSILLRSGIVLIHAAVCSLF